jgi:Zn-dependent metalloprotease
MPSKSNTGSARLLHKPLILTTATLALLHTPLYAAQANTNSNPGIKRIDLRELPFTQTKAKITSPYTQHNSTVMGSDSEKLRQALNLDTKHELQYLRKTSDRSGSQHIRYQQRYQGIPVWGEHIIVHKDKTGDITRITGRVINNLEKSSMAQNTAPPLSDTDALETVKQHLGHDSNQWQISGQSSQLVIYIDGENLPKKAYSVNYFADSIANQPTRPFVLLDAYTGDVVTQWEGLTHAEATGPGGNEKTGRYTYGQDLPALTVEQQGSTCSMVNDNVKTLNMNHDKDDGTIHTFSCPENTVKEINGAYSPLNDAHFYSGNATNMYLDWLNTAPLTFPVVARVHYGQEYENAFWNGTSTTYGDGKDNLYPPVDVNVVAHEISHGFTEQNSGLAYIWQSGGMNEAFSDMAGEAAELYLRGTVDWMVAAEITKNLPAHRYFEDPTLDGVSISHASDYNDSLDVHYTSGVYNRAYFLLSHADGWTQQMAFEVFALANKNYWGPTETFAGGACGVMEAASDLGYDFYPVDSAFQTVGVDCGSFPFIDEDGDQMDDNWEVDYGLDPTNPADRGLDKDSDGLNNVLEYLGGSDPTVKDTDNDGIEDGSEVFTYHTHPLKPDTDSDGLTDGEEVNQHATDPLNADSDDDTMPDGWEVSYQLNPNDRLDAFGDADNDGWTNAQEHEQISNPTDNSSKPPAPGGSEVTIAPIESGNYKNDAPHHNPSKGVIRTGAIQLFGLREFRGFIGFDIPSGVYSQAVIKIDPDGFLHFSPDPIERFRLYDVDTSPSALFDGSAGFEGWEDLGSGNVFAEQTVTPEDENSVLEIPLNTAAVASINASAGDVFITGSRLMTIEEGRSEIEYIFSRSDSSTIRLELLRPHDIDGDGMTDEWEEQQGFDKYSAADAIADNDGDALVNLQEFINNTDPAKSDTDSDAMPDFWEVVNLLNPLLNDASLDPDGDGRSNLQEFNAGTDPNDANSQ